jgi:hypothetical protein
MDGRNMVMVLAPDKRAKQAAAARAARDGETAEPPVAAASGEKEIVADRAVPVDGSGVSTQGGPAGEEES